MAAPAKSFLSSLGVAPPAPDGPARVVKGSAATAAPATDWKPVPDKTMRGFSLQNFGGPGRAAAPNLSEGKLEELRQALHKSEEHRRKSVEESKDEMVQMAKAALAEGMEKGRVEGEKEAYAKYQKQLEQLKQNTEATLQQLSAEKAEAFLGYERLCLDLFALSLRKLTGELPQWHEETVVPMLREAIAALSGNTAMTVRVNPADFLLAKEKRHLWETLETGSPDLVFEADNRIPKGGCLIESGATSATADPNAVAERIVEAVRHVYQARLDQTRRESDAGLHG